MNEYGEPLNQAAYMAAYMAHLELNARACAYVAAATDRRCPDWDRPARWAIAVKAVAWAEQASRAYIEEDALYPTNTATWLEALAKLNALEAEHEAVRAAKVKVTT